MNCRILLTLLVLFLQLQSVAQHHVLDTVKHHLRNRSEQEWASFATKANAEELDILFNSKKNAAEQTLSLTQFDVKQEWRIFINGKDIGMLEADEKKMIKYYAIREGVLKDGENKLVIRTEAMEADDIEIGNLKLDSRPVRDVISESVVEITIVDGDRKELLPGRITILNKNKILQTIMTPSPEMLAVRPGCVYTGNGKAVLHLPAGSYTFYAGRGFEYGIDSVRVNLKPGDNIKKTLSIRREVNTKGWISSDTHVHTFTHSHHGDATLEERALTLAGEGIELPIMTDHNIYVDLKPVARNKNLLPYFTPVVGDELTTAVGHFNVFPATVGTPVINHQVENWKKVSDAIKVSTKSNVIILNHARDIHHKFRPFDPSLHLSCAGIRSDGCDFPANAMEVINSGSQQTDIMQLYHDWFGMLNHGIYLTPVGSSDSHDVSRYTVGQGRTYIQSENDDPATFDVDKLIRNFQEGRVMVSLGLLPKILVNKKYGPGDLAPLSSKQINVSVEVLGPSWTQVDKISLYANGKKIREEKIKKTSSNGIIWKDSWSLPSPVHDIFLVAVAEGPGEGMPYWPIAKPYQPKSTEWTPHVFGSTGAVWIDGDKDGKRSCAYDYAKQIVASSESNFYKMIQLLSSYDEAVAIQVAALLWKNGKTLQEKEISQGLLKASVETKSGFEKVRKALALLKK